jgi:hypothetical protein
MSEPTPTPSPPPPYLSPRTLQVLGILLLVGSAGFWAVTGRESVLLMSSAMSLIGIGAYRGATETLRKAARLPSLPPDEPG